MDLAAKGWISRPTPPSLPRPRAVPQFPHLPDGGKMPISCLMHFELIPPPTLGRAGDTPRLGSPRWLGPPNLHTPLNPPSLYVAPTWAPDWFGFGAVSHSLELFLGLGLCFVLVFSFLPGWLFPI